MTAEELKLTEVVDKEFEEMCTFYPKIKQAILDCWSWLEPKPRTQSIWLSERMRNEELVANQEELINALREILEPIVDKIKETQDE